MRSPDNHPLFRLALTFDHLARWAAVIFLLDAAETCRLTPARPVELCFAHRAFCARLIFLRAEADIVRLPCRLGSVYDLPPSSFPRTARAASTCLSSFTRLVRCSLNCETIDSSPFRLAMCPPRVGIVANDCPVSGQQKAR